MKKHIYGTSVSTTNEKGERIFVTFMKCFRAFGWEAVYKNESYGDWVTIPDTEKGDDIFDILAQQFIETMSRVSGSPVKKPYIYIQD